MSDKTARIGEILDVMKNTWDLPADCNEGELFAYAETLYEESSAASARMRFTPISPAFRPTIWKCRGRTPQARSSTARSRSPRTGADWAPARRLAIRPCLWQEPQRWPRVSRGSIRCSSSVVEHSLGKGEVESSILSCSTIHMLMATIVRAGGPEGSCFAGRSSHLACVLAPRSNGRAQGDGRHVDGRDRGNLTLLPAIFPDLMPP